MDCNECSNDVDASNPFATANNGPPEVYSGRRQEMPTPEDGWPILLKKTVQD